MKKYSDLQTILYALSTMRISSSSETDFVMMLRNTITTRRTSARNSMGSSLSTARSTGFTMNWRRVGHQVLRIADTTAGRTGVQNFILFCIGIQDNNGHKCKLRSLQDNYFISKSQYLTAILRYTLFKSTYVITEEMFTPDMLLDMVSTTKIKIVNYISQLAQCSH